MVCSAAVKIITGSQGKVQGLLGIDTLGISKLTRLAAQAWGFFCIPAQMQMSGRIDTCPSSSKDCNRRLTGGRN